MDGPAAGGACAHEARLLGGADERAAGGRRAGEAQPRRRALDRQLAHGGLGGPGSPDDDRGAGLGGGPPRRPGRFRGVRRVHGRHGRPHAKGPRPRLLLSSQAGILGRGLLQGPSRQGEQPGERAGGLHHDEHGDIERGPGRDVLGSAGGVRGESEDVGRVERISGPGPRPGGLVQRDAARRPDRAHLLPAPGRRHVRQHPRPAQGPVPQAAAGRLRLH
mmetsp:Transcript_17266/g.54209  ORF Transcript_17266/g.54209 Transcript_17266/m.54209 type:complete len:219 (-) Transcript_17266:198-854(-)